MTRRKFCLKSIVGAISVLLGKAKAASDDFVCLQCGACCWAMVNKHPLQDCAEKNLIWADGKYWCTIHPDCPEKYRKKNPPPYPQICRDYPDNGVCLRMMAEKKIKENKNASMD